MRKKVTRNDIIWTLVLTTIVMLSLDYIIFFVYDSYRSISANINSILTMGDFEKHQYILQDMARNKNFTLYTEDISIIRQGGKPKIAVLMYTRGRFFDTDTYIMFAFEDGTLKTFIKSETFFHVNESQYPEKSLAAWILEISDEDAELKCNGKMIARTYSPDIKTAQFIEDKYSKYCYFKNNINHIMGKYGYVEYER